MVPWKSQMWRAPIKEKVGVVENNLYKLYKHRAEQSDRSFIFVLNVGANI